MSHALMALIFIVVDSHDGEWVPLSWIVNRVAMQPLSVLHACLNLVEECQLCTRDIGGEPHFGVHVHAGSQIAQAA